VFYHVFREKSFVIKGSKGVPGVSLRRCSYFFKAKADSNAFASPALPSTSCFSADLIVNQVDSADTGVLVTV
jgi:hypothetical protein